MTTTSSTPLHKTIRFGVFLFGLVIATIVIAKSYQSPSYFFLQLVFGLWLISPNIVFLFGTWKLRSRFSLLGLALLLCSIQLYFVVTYFTTHHATAPIILLISPIPEFGILALGLAIAYLAEYGQSHWHTVPPQAPHLPTPLSTHTQSTGTQKRAAEGVGTTHGGQPRARTRRGRAGVRKKVQEKRRTNRPKKGKRKLRRG